MSCRPVTTRACAPTTLQALAVALSVIASCHQSVAMCLQVHNWADQYDKQAELAGLAELAWRHTISGGEQRKHIAPSIYQHKFLSMTMLQCYY